MFNDKNNIKIFVKNISDQDFTIEEIGGYVLHPNDEINMLDTTLKVGNNLAYYSDSQAVLRAIKELTGTGLYRAIHDVAPKLSYRVETILVNK